MKKQLIVLSLLLVIVTVLVVLFFADSPDQLSNSDERNFSLERLEEASSFKLTHSNSSVTINRINQRWFINGEDINLIHFQRFKSLVENLSVKYRAAKNTSDSIANELKRSGVKFECFEDENTLACYYVGKDLKDSSGAYCMKCDGEMPFVLYELGGKKLFTDLFVVNENTWRSKEVFSIKGERIKSVQLTYFKDDTSTNELKVDLTESFSIHLDTADIMVLNGSKNEIKTVDLSLVVDYLRAFSEVKAKEIVVDSPDAKPYFEMVLQLEAKAIKLVAYRKKATAGQVDFTGKPLQIDNEFFYVKKGATMYLVDYFTFDALLKKAADFKK